MERLVETGHSVIVRNGNVAAALRKFKQKMKDANLYIDLKKNERYMKPSRLKKEARNKGKRRTEFNRMKAEEADNRKIY